MSLGGYNMSTKKKIEKELEKENIIKEIKKAQTDVAVAEKFFQFVSDPELVQQRDLPQSYVLYSE